MNLSKSNHPAILNFVNISMITVFHRNHFYYTALTGLHVTMQSSFRFFTSRFRQFLDSGQKHSHHRYFIDPRHICYSYEKTPYRKLYKKAFHENHFADFTELHTYTKHFQYTHIGVLGREFQALPFHSSLRIISSAFDIKNNQILPFFT